MQFFFRISNIAKETLGKRALTSSCEMAVLTVDDAAVAYLQLFPRT